MFRRDPGPCIVCGAAHTACTVAPRGRIAISQLPARDLMVATPELAVQTDAGEELSVNVALRPGSFTTATYRRKKAK